MEVLRGYLSLHQAGEHLTLKWTPNQLINGTLGDCDDLEKRCVRIRELLPCVAL